MIKLSHTIFFNYLKFWTILPLLRLLKTSDGKAANNIPAEFISNSIDSSDCSKSGKLKINGTFKTELKNDLNLNFHLIVQKT